MTQIPDNSIEELKEFLAPFVAFEDKVNDNSETYESFCEVIKTLPLPPFYELEPMRPYYSIVGKPEGLTVIDRATEEVLFETQDIDETVTFARKARADYDFVGDFSHLPNARIGVDEFEARLFGDPIPEVRPEDRHKKVYVGSSHVDTHALEHSRYYNWLVRAVNFLENPNAFMKAWDFLDNHPFAWTKSVSDHGVTHWKNDELIGRMWLQPNVRDNGSVYFMMEAGGAKPDRDGLWRDLRFDVYENTFEDCVIETAKRVHKFFHLDGTERKDVDYEKSALEKSLDIAIDDYNLLNPENPLGGNKES